MVPELLFQPGMIGLDQCGIPEAIHSAITTCHEGVHGLLFAHVVLAGGCSRLPGFVERVRRDLRALVPDEYELRCDASSDPIGMVWRGGMVLA